MPISKKIILTGGTGFLGSHILKLLLLNNRKAVVLKRSFSNTRRIQTLFKDKQISALDIDRDSFEECFRVGDIDAVIHTATCYGRTGESVFDVFESNLRMPLELLNMSIKYRTPAFINTDTFTNEEVEARGKEKFYAKTKKDFIEYAYGAIKGSGTKFFNLKIEQMYGPDDNPTKFIPFIIKKLLKNEEVSLTSGEQKRDFIFVEDCAAAYASVLKNIKKLNQFEEFGIGTGSALSLRSAVEKIKQHIGSESLLNWGAMPYRQNEIMSSYANVSNNKKIEWSALYSLDDGIQKTVDYYRLHI